MLNDHHAILIPRHRAGMRMQSRALSFGALPRLANRFHLNYVFAVRRMNNVVRVAMENDGTDTWLM